MSTSNQLAQPTATSKEFTEAPQLADNDFLSDPEDTNYSAPYELAEPPEMQKERKEGKQKPKHPNLNLHVLFPLPKDKRNDDNNGSPPFTPSISC